MLQHKLLVIELTATHKGSHHRTMSSLAAGGGKYSLNFSPEYDPHSSLSTLPTSMEEVLGGRIDALPPTQQMLIKVCACAGVSFPLTAIVFAFPVRDPATLESLGAEFEELCKLGLLVRDGGAPANDDTSASAVLRSRSAGKSFMASKSFVAEDSAERAAELAAAVKLTIEQQHARMKEAKGASAAPAESLPRRMSVTEKQVSAFQQMAVKKHSNMLRSSDESDGWFIVDAHRFVQSQGHVDTEEERRLNKLLISFENGMIRDVAYARLPFSYRCQLHRQLATWYETTYTDLTSLIGLLSRHWQAVAEMETNEVVCI
jgi:hypothetical protein